MNQLRRLRVTRKRYRPYLAPGNPGNHRALGRDCRRMTVAQLSRRAVERRDPDFLLYPGGAASGISGISPRPFALPPRVKTTEEPSFAHSRSLISCPSSSVNRVAAEALNPCPLATQMFRTPFASCTQATASPPGAATNPSTKGDPRTCSRVNAGAPKSGVGEQKEQP